MLTRQCRWTRCSTWPPHWMCRPTSSCNSTSDAVNRPQYTTKPASCQQILPNSACCATSDMAFSIKWYEGAALLLPLLSSIPQRVDSPCHSAKNYKNSAGALHQRSFFTFFAKGTVPVQPDRYTAGIKIRRGAFSWKLFWRFCTASWAIGR